MVRLFRGEPWMLHACFGCHPFVGILLKQLSDEALSIFGNVLQFANIKIILTGEDASYGSKSAASIEWTFSSCYQHVCNYTKSPAI